MLSFSKGMKDASGNEIDSSQFDQWKTQITDGITALQNELDNLGVGDSVYDKLGGEDWVNALNDMSAATGMSVAEMQNYLDTLGLDAEVNTKTIPVTTKEPKIVYKVQGSMEDGTMTIVPEQQGTIDITRDVEFATINGDVTYTGNGNVAESSVNSSGGGGSPKKLERTKKSDMVDRYKEINDQLATTQRQIEKVNREADALWGPARIKKMQEAAALMKQEN
jgi:uncharacterized coiled-coil protein SlyX